MQKKRYLSNKGNSYIWLIIFVVIFLGIGMIVMDQGSLYLNNKKVKDGLNRSVKAAALAINENEQLAKGIFTIDPARAEINFKKILAENIGLNEVTLEPLPTGSLVTERLEVKEFVVQNTIPTTYYSLVLKNGFDFKYPSVLAVIQVKVKGVFSSQNFTLYKLSSSQLTSIYD